jgi:hypothetical protein
MRLIGMLLALAAIGWVILQVSGGGDDSGAVPGGAYQDSMDKARALEDSVQDAAKERLQRAEGANP